MNQSYYENRVVQLCSNYAAIAHIKQNRKYELTPYIVHPARVAALASDFMRNRKRCYIYTAAAWLHDVMEDCSVIFKGEYSYEIKNHDKKICLIDEFLTEHDFITFEDGIKIFEAVVALTMSQDESIPKEDRKKMYYKKLLQSDLYTIIIKYSDRIDNLLTVDMFSQDGFKAYIKDTENMMSILEKFRKGLSTGDLLRMLFPHGMLQQALAEVKIKYKEMYETI